MFFEVKPDVMMGGGTPNFLAKSDTGSQAQGRRELPREVRSCGLPFVATNSRAEGRRADKAKAARPVPSGQSRRRARPLLAQEGHRRQIPRPARSRRPGRTRRSTFFPKNDKGFVLMVESGRIDKYSATRSTGSARSTTPSCSTMRSRSPRTSPRRATTR